MSDRGLRRGFLPLAALAAAAVAGSAVAQVADKESFAQVVLLLLATSCVVAVGRKPGGWRSHPALVVGWAYILTLALAPLIYAATWQAPGASVTLDPGVASGLGTSALFAVATACLAVGSILGNPRPARGGAVPPPIRSAMNAATSTRTLGLALLPLAYLTSYGADRLLVRDEYIGEFQVGGVWAVAETLSLPALLTLGLVYARASGGKRSFALLVALAYLLVFLSTGSRRVALALPFFAVGVWLVGRWTRWRTLAAVLLCVQAVVLLPLPLALRGLDQHGLVPYGRAIFTGAILVNDSTFQGVGRNLSISYPLAAQVAFAQPRLGLSDLATSLNPLPGRLTDWYQIAPRLRLNQFTPYSAVGELGNYGLPVLSAYMITVGYLFGVAARLSQRARSTWKVYLDAVVLGCAGMFAVLSLQYNLRSVTRLPLYLLIIVALAIFASNASFLQTSPWSAGRKRRLFGRVGRRIASE